MLHFTPEEKETIIKNLKTVQRYVEEKLIPRLKEHETATAYIDSKMSFAISSDGSIRFTVGGLSLYFDEDAHRDNNIFDSWPYGAKLLLKWWHIKCSINETLDQMEADRKAILDFQV